MDIPLDKFSEKEIRIMQGDDSKITQQMNINEFKKDLDALCLKHNLILESAVLLPITKGLFNPDCVDINDGTVDRLKKYEHCLFEVSIEAKTLCKGTL